MFPLPCVHATKTVSSCRACPPMYVKTGPADCVDETTGLVQQAGRWTLRSVMERNQDTVRHTGHCWPSTASWLISSRLDSVLPLDPDRPGGESEADDIAQLSLTLIKLSRKSSSPPPSSLPLTLLYQSPGNTLGTLGAVATDLHTGGSDHRVVSHWTETATIPQSPEPLSSPLLDCIAHLHSMRSGLGKVSQALPASTSPGQQTAVGGDPITAVQTTEWRKPRFIQSP